MIRKDNLICSSFPSSRPIPSQKSLQSRLLTSLWNFGIIMNKRSLARKFPILSTIIETLYIPITINQLTPPKTCINKFPHRESLLESSEFRFSVQLILYSLGNNHISSNNFSNRHPNAYHFGDCIQQTHATYLVSIIHPLEVYILPKMNTNINPTPTPCSYSLQEQGEGWERKEYLAVHCPYSLFLVLDMIAKRIESFASKLHKIIKSATMRICTKWFECMEYSLKFILN